MNVWIINSSHSSTNPENLAKIGAALSEITSLENQPLKNKVTQAKDVQQGCRAGSIAQTGNDLRRPP